MKSKRKILLISSSITISALTAVTCVLTLNRTLSYANDNERVLTIDGNNTIHRLYQTSTPGYPEYRNVIIFEMLDKQAYGYVTPSQAQTVDDDTSFLMTMWHANPSGAGFVINGDDHSGLNLYLDYDRTQKVEPVKFRNIEKVEFVVDTSDDYRYTDLVCTAGELSFQIVDENTKLYTWTPTNSEEYQVTRICGAPEPKEYEPPHPSRVLWILSMTFYYSC